MFAVRTPQVHPIVVKIAVNGTTIEMEVDTGAAVLLVSECTWKQIRGQVKGKQRLESLPVTAEQLRAVTGCDEILGKVLLTQKGWPTKVNDNLKPYWIWQDEITIVRGCECWCLRSCREEYFRNCTKVTQGRHE